MNVETMGAALHDSVRECAIAVFAEQTRKTKPAAGAPAAGFLISDDLQVLEHAEHDRADKGESNIRGDDTKLADERTKGHRKPPEVRTLIALTRKASDPFHGKKVSVAVHPRHLGGAQ